MAARPIRHRLYMGRPDNYMGRPMCCPVLKGACAYADVIFYVNCWFFVVFSRLDSVGQLLSAHKTHITSTHCSHNSAPPTTRSDCFLWTTTSSCCCNARSSSSNSSSTYMPLQHPVLLHYTLPQHPLSSKDNASTSSDILAAASHATAAAVLIPGSTSTHM